MAVNTAQPVRDHEPPPKGILEDVSAKGGDLLTRTVENVFPYGSREAERLRNRYEEEDDNDNEKAAKDDKIDVNEPGSVGRSTRCMLQRDASVSSH
jgi:chromatin structure-remodeling complex subunit RSC9